MKSMKFNRAVAVLALAAVLILALCACSKEQERLVFTAEITAIYDASIDVTTTDDVGFTEATVVYADDMKPIAFNLIVGQKIKITALPNVAETSPVQVTALSIELAAD